MPSCNILKEEKIVPSFRVSQVRGIFDLPLDDKMRFELSIDLPIEERDWKIGLIVGPCGSGKSVAARELFGHDSINSFDWPVEKSILDSFPPEMSIKDVTQLLTSVTFSSPSSWLLPYHCLSSGEKFKATLALALASENSPIVIDEFTNMIPRDVAMIASICVAKAVRREEKKRLVAVSSHRDIIDWLEPDWIYSTESNEFMWRSLRGRPKIILSLARVHHSAWRLFSKHHYLGEKINSACKGFVAFWNLKPVAFIGIIFFPHPKLKRVWKIHRHVCLPDYQGVGIGGALEDTIASMLKTCKYSCYSPVSHPAKIHYLVRSGKWKIIRKPSMCSGSKMKLWEPDKLRLQTTFEYIGPPYEDPEISHDLMDL